MDTISKWDTVKIAVSIAFIWWSFTIIRDGVRMHNETGDTHIFAGACMLLSTGVALGMTITMMMYRNTINAKLKSGEWTLTENY